MAKGIAQFARLCAVPIIASLTVLAVGSVPVAGEPSSACRHYGLGTIQGLTAIRIRVPIGAELPLQHPVAICFDLPIRELSLLREALERGPVEVIVFDDGGRQLTSGGTVVVIDNALHQGNIRVRAIFPAHPN